MTTDTGTTTTPDAEVTPRAGDLTESQRAMVAGELAKLGAGRPKTGPIGPITDDASPPLSLGDAAPNPQPGPDLVTFDDIDHLQRRYCARRAECLRVAASHNWPSFTCGSCSVDQLLVGEPLRAERIRLLGVARVVMEMLRGERDSVGEPRPSARRRAA